MLCASWYSHDLLGGPPKQMHLASVLRFLSNRIVPLSRQGLEIENVGPVARWAGLQQDEIDFWDNALSQTRLNPGKPLQSYLTQLIDAAPGSKVEILDVGAGPLT